MNLIVKIPCYNEESTLPSVLDDILQRVDGCDVVELLVVDDGSTDRMTEVAQESGVDYPVRQRANFGLARASQWGLDGAIRLGVDVIMTTSGANQYPGYEIPRLVQPILRREADIGVGDRRPSTLEHLSFIKRRLQSLGSRVVRALSGPHAPDAVSGFRATSRDAALRLNLLSPLSYTIERLIQAGSKNLVGESVAVDTNPTPKQPRRTRGTSQFLGSPGVTMVYMYHVPAPPDILLVRSEGGFDRVDTHRPLSLSLVHWRRGRTLPVSGPRGALVLVGFMTLMIGLVADLIILNRRSLGLTLKRVRRLGDRMAPDPSKGFRALRMMVQEPRTRGGDSVNPTGSEKRELPHVCGAGCPRGALGHSAETP